MYSAIENIRESICLNNCLVTLMCNDSMDFPIEIPRFAFEYQSMLYRKIKPQPCEFCCPLLPGQVPELIRGTIRPYNPPSGTHLFITAAILITWVTLSI